MRVLLDTHVLLWSLADDPKLSANARRLIEGATDIYVSSASYWELAIKIGLGKLAADLAEIRLNAEQSGYLEVPVTGEHAQATLLLANHHKDPFDRLIIATAITEPMRLLTADSIVAQYTELATLI
ncbi:type II toxin-antitoxin system VapC family toxin [Andreprevotia chitinilytica]|uniref:type II toxin-antitoxin system VapC family toxin n=1 Tax=Andreprevotia chitinilytica TaxID=396808 RepID=UPI000553D0B8|nr:type II toxin-antitoxin system VapC family toxin [Andreprevotia chitinilytica]